MRYKEGNNILIAVTVYFNYWISDNRQGQPRLSLKVIGIRDKEY